MKKNLYLLTMFCGYKANNRHQDPYITQFMFDQIYIYSRYLHKSKKREKEKIFICSESKPIS